VREREGVFVFVCVYVRNVNRERNKVSEGLKIKGFYFCFYLGSGEFVSPTSLETCKWKKYDENFRCDMQRTVTAWKCKQNFFFGRFFIFSAHAVILSDTSLLLGLTYESWLLLLLLQLLLLFTVVAVVTVVSVVAVVTVAVVTVVL